MGSRFRPALHDLMLAQLAIALAVASLALAADAPRIVTDAPRVVIIDIDGVRAQTFEQAYIERHLQNFERILGTVANGNAFQNAVVFEHATTVFPSVTMAAQASIFTGVYPGRHGIPGNAWFDRASAQLINYMTPTSMACVYSIDLLLAGCQGGMADNQLTSPTIYEFAARAGKTSTVVFNQYYKGATTAVLPSIEDAFGFLEGYDIDYRAFDTRMMDRAVDSLAAGLPDLLTVYFAGADGVAHQLGIASQLDYFQTVIDPQLGRLLNELERLDPEWRSHTLFVITSDHGRTDAEYHPEDRDLADRINADLEHFAGPSQASELVTDGGMAYVYVPSGGDTMQIARELIGDPGLEAAVDSILVREDTPAGYRLVQRGHNVQRLPPEWQALVDNLAGNRTGDLVLILNAGHYFGNTGLGSEHGSIFQSDLGVPLILAEGSVIPLRSDKAASTTQIVATVASYLGIAVEGVAPVLPDVRFWGAISRVR